MRFRTLAAIAGALAWSAAASAQPLGRLQVTVVDPSGAVIAGARVAVVAVGDAGPVVSAQTGDRGSAMFERLAPGHFTVRVESAGFEPYEGRDVRVRSGENRRQVRLALAKFAETVRVERDPRTRGSDPRGDAFATILNQRQIDDLPDDPDEMERILNDLAGPGATIRVNGFRGGRLPAKDQIQQIRFRRNMFAADTHEAGSVAIDIITKPGVEKWRGSVAGFGRVSALNARHAFAPAKPDERYGRYSLSMSGPLWKNHTSVAMSVDGSDAFESTTIVAALPTGFYSDTVRRPLASSNVSARVEHALSSSMLRGEIQRHRVVAENLGAGDFDLPERAYSQVQRDLVARISIAGSLRPSLFNEFRFQVRDGEAVYTPASLRPAVVVQNAFTAGGAQIGGERQSRQIDVSDDLDVAIGSHAIRAGVLIERSGVTSSVARNMGGTFTYASLEAFAAGMPTTFTRNVGDPLVRVSPWRIGAYVQDDYRVRKDLTLSGGVRAEHQSPIEGLHLGPRAGVAWSPFRSGATTIRGGAGVFFDWFDALAYEQALQLDGSHQTIDTISATVALPPGRVRLSDDLLQPRLFDARIGVEQTLPHDVRLNATIGRRRGTHELRGINVNAPVGGVRPDPGSGPVTEIRSEATSESASLSLNVNYAPSRRRVFVAATYVLGRSTNESDGALSLPADSHGLASERGPAPGDVRHRFTSLFSTPIAGRMRLGLAARVQSALPYNITTGRDDDGDTVSNDRPAGVSRNTGRGRGLTDISIRLSWSKGFGVRSAPGGRPGPQTRTRGDDANPLASLGGGVDLTKRVTLELSLQAYNALNRTNAINFGGVMTSPFFGRPTSSAPPRRLELGARVGF